MRLDNYCLNISIQALLMNTKKKQQKEGTTQICYPLFTKITLKKFE